LEGGVGACSAKAGVQVIARSENSQGATEVLWFFIVIIEPLK